MRAAADSREARRQGGRISTPICTEIILYASHPTEEFPVITGSSSFRGADLKTLTDPTRRRAIQDRGIILTIWRELMERRHRAAPME